MPLPAHALTCRRQALAQRAQQGMDGGASSPPGRVSWFQGARSATPHACLSCACGPQAPGARASTQRVAAPRDRLPDLAPVALQVPVQAVWPRGVQLPHLPGAGRRAGRAVGGGPPEAVQVRSARSPRPSAPAIMRCVPTVVSARGRPPPRRVPLDAAMRHAPACSAPPAARPLRPPAAASRRRSARRAASRASRGTTARTSGRRTCTSRTATGCTRSRWATPSRSRTPPTGWPPPSTSSATGEQEPRRQGVRAASLRVLVQSAAPSPPPRAATFGPWEAEDRCARHATALWRGAFFAGAGRRASPTTSRASRQRRVSARSHRG